MLRQRLDRMEEELKKLKEESRIGTIEYHIESLTVESIQNGILDLGVHMGNELDKRIQTSGDSKDQPSEGKKNLENRITQVESDVMEVKEQILDWAERFQTHEEQIRSLEERVRSLEALHW